MTASERAHEAAVLEQAVFLLNNHLPGYGVRFVSKDSDDLALHGTATFMDDAPDAVQAALAGAIVAAARYAEQTFRSYLATTTEATQG